MRGRDTQGGGKGGTCPPPSRTLKVGKKKRDGKKEGKGKKDERKRRKLNFSSFVLLKLFDFLVNFKKITKTIRQINLNGGDV